jgi:hypothetical protein
VPYVLNDEQLDLVTAGTASVSVEAFVNVVGTNGIVATKATTSNVQGTTVNVIRGSATAIACCGKEK